MEGVIQARANATKTTIDPTNVTPEQMAAFQESQNSLSGALSRLMVVAERYPDLKANQNFLELQSQLEGTENRINVERNRYNDVATDYNIYVKKFPASLVARYLKFSSAWIIQDAVCWKPKECLNGKL
ncbi:MAG: LemA family protein [Flavobacteriaceae bacterium]|nr:LemA family protein [Flavobacteriaceae bacterium]